MRHTRSPKPQGELVSLLLVFVWEPKFTLQAAIAFLLRYQRWVRRRQVNSSFPVEMSNTSRFAPWGSCPR